MYTALNTVVYSQPPVIEGMAHVLMPLEPKQPIKDENKLSLI
jgi:hypothetical protein